MEDASSTTLRRWTAQLCSFEARPGSICSTVTFRSTLLLAVAEPLQSPANPNQPSSTFP